MAQDKNIHKYANKVVIGADYAYSHGLKDIDGRQIYSIRQLKAAANFLPASLRWVGNWIPGFIFIPQFVFDIFYSKY